MTKAALILGDYSNGWSDSIMVQTVTNIPNIKQFNADREFVGAVLSKHLHEAVKELEANDKINPKPLDELCCAGFEMWAKDQKVQADYAFCPFCKTAITKERRQKYFVKEGE